jgi:hypothetical protein
MPLLHVVARPVRVQPSMPPPDYPSGMPSASHIQSQLRSIATRHSRDPVGDVAGRAAELAVLVASLEERVNLAIAALDEAGMLPQAPTTEPALPRSTSPHGPDARARRRLPRVRRRARLLLADGL